MTSATHAEPANEPAPIRLLLVEDDLSLRNALATYLSRFDCKVIVAGNGREALCVLDAGAKVDVVVTDIVMPELEGIELIMELSRRHPLLKVVAVSGGGRVGPSYYLQSAKLLGAASVIAKPFTPEKLLETVRAVVAA